MNDSLFNPSILARLGSFRLRAKRLASGVSFGEHRSIRMGVSTEFQDHRPWEPGDDPKFIDWRVYARTGRLFQRRFRETTNHTFRFLNDFSSSMRYVGHCTEPRLSKLEYTQCVTAVLAFLALQQRDLVGLSAVNGSETVSLRSSSGESHWTECLNFLETPPFKSSATVSVRSFAEILTDFASSCTHRGKIFIFSDLLDVESWDAILTPMKLLVAQGNELVLFHVLDHDELEFPFDGAKKFEPLEGNGSSVTLNSQDVREAYMKSFQTWRKSIMDGCRMLGMEYILADTRTEIHELLLRLV